MYKYICTCIIFNAYILRYRFIQIFILFHTHIHTRVILMRYLMIILLVSYVLMVSLLCIREENRERYDYAMCVHTVSFM